MRHPQLDLFTEFPIDMYGGTASLLVLLDVVAKLGIHERIGDGLATFLQVFCPEEFFVDSVSEQLFLNEV